MSKNNGDGKKPLPNISTDLTNVKSALSNAKPINVIHFRGDLDKVKFNGKTWRRQESLYMGENFGLVKCTPYDDHFILYDPDHLGWTTFCTCGAPAVVIGYSAYKADASAQGKMLACYAHVHLTPGKHMPVNWK